MKACSCMYHSYVVKLQVDMAAACYACLMISVNLLKVKNHNYVNTLGSVAVTKYTTRVLHSGSLSGYWQGRTGLSTSDWAWKQ